MHLLMVLTMPLLGAVTALAAVAEARHGAPAPHWAPHLAMGAVMAGMHISDPYLLWTSGSVLAAAAVWTGIRHGGSANPRADCTDLASCAVLLGALAARKGADEPSMSPGTHHSGCLGGQGTVLYAAASLVAVLTAVTWSVARSTIYVRASREAVHLRVAEGARTRRWATFVARTTGLVMVPLMTGTVIWG